MRRLNAAHRCACIEGLSSEAGMVTPVGGRIQTFRNVGIGSGYHDRQIDSCLADRGICIISGKRGLLGRRDVYPRPRRSLQSGLVG